MLVAQYMTTTPYLNTVLAVQYLTTANAYLNTLLVAQYLTAAHLLSTALVVQYPPSSLNGALLHEHRSCGAIHDHLSPL